MRIIAGVARGRRLRPVRAAVIRPTSDRVREALFSILISARHGAGFEGLEILDLYAGTGALGLEALSRGAARATLVESDPEAARTLAANVELCGFGDRVAVVRESVEAWMRAAPARGKFDLVFMDPPYARRLEAADLAPVATCLRPGGVLVVEHAARPGPPDEAAGLRLFDRRRYGRTGVSLYRRDDTARTAGSSERAMTS